MKQRDAKRPLARWKCWKLGASCQRQKLCNREAAGIRLVVTTSGCHHIAVPSSKEHSSIRESKSFQHHSSSHNGLGGSRSRNRSCSRSRSRSRNLSRQQYRSARRPRKLTYLIHQRLHLQPHPHSQQRIFFHLPALMQSQPNGKVLNNPRC